jgi:hypothetical protein
MSKNAFEPPTVENPRGWEGLRYARILVLSAVPVFILRAFFASAGLRDALLYGGLLMMVTGMFLAGTYRCPVCDDRFLRFRWFDYLQGFWAYRIMLQPYCTSCKTDVGTRPDEDDAGA